MKLTPKSLRFGLTLFLAFVITHGLHAQNVGINEQNPTNTLHIKPLNAGDEPLRVEGLSVVNSGDNALLIHNPAIGVVRYITMNNLSDSLITSITNNQTFLDSIVSIIHDYGDTLLYNQTFISNLQDSIDTHLDSLILTGNTLSGWVDGLNYDVDLTSLTGVDTSDVVNIIYNFGDTLLYNNTFLNNLQDSIDTHLDSLVLNGTILTGWVDGNANTVDLVSLIGTDSQDLTSATLSGNILTIDIQNGASTTVDLSGLVGTDNQDLTSATLAGNVLTIDIQNGASVNVDLSALVGTDNQDLTGATLSGNDLTIDIQNGASTTVDLSPLVGTDNQTLSLAGNDLSISNGNTVNLSSLSDHDWYQANTTSQPTTIGQSIFTNGSVGIGTNDPQSALHLSGTALQLWMENTSGTGNTFALNSTNGGDFRLLNFAGGTTIPLTVLGTNDNVGINTTNPQQKLHVFDGRAYVSRSTGNQSILLGADGGIELYRSTSSAFSPTRNGYIDYKDVETDDYDFRTFYQHDLSTNGGFVFESTTNGLPGTRSSRMVILNGNGNVGINTTNPLQKLHIFDGSAYLSNSSGQQSTVVGSDGGIELFRDPASAISPNTNGYIDYKDLETDDYDFRTYYDYNLSTNGGYVMQSTTDGQSGTAISRMTILNGSGNVGIGTTAPSHRLEVNGDIMMNNTVPDGARFIYRGGTGGTQEYRARVAASGHLGFFPLEAGSPGYVGEPIIMTQDGKVGVGDHLTPFFALELKNQNSIFGQGRAFAWVTYSDERVKSDQKPIPNALETVIKLKPLYYFHHNSEKSKNGIKISEEGGYSYGFLAQELYEELPDIVFKPEDDSNELWSVDYDKLIPILTKAIQEQQLQIEELKAERAKLESQQQEIDVLRKSLEELQKKFAESTK